MPRLEAFGRDKVRLRRNSEFDGVLWANCNVCGAVLGWDRIGIHNHLEVTNSPVNVTPTAHPDLNAWVEACARLCQPERIHWCDGSEEEKAWLIRTMEADGTLRSLNQDAAPGCYLHRSAQSDV